MIKTTSRARCDTFPWKANLALRPSSLKDQETRNFRMSSIKKTTTITVFASSHGIVAFFEMGSQQKLTHAKWHRISSFQQDFFNYWRRFFGTNHYVQIPCPSLVPYLAGGPLPATVTTRITCLVRAAGHIQRFSPPQSSNTWLAQCHPETVWMFG